MGFLDKLQQAQGGPATSATPSQIRSQPSGRSFVPQTGFMGKLQAAQGIAPQIQQQQQEQQRQQNLQTIQQGVDTSQRFTRGQEVEDRGIIGAIGNFMLGTAPDILARNITSRDPQIQQLRQELISNAEQDITNLGGAIQAARDRGDEARARHLEGVLANNLETANDLLGQGFFNAPTILQNIGAAATVGLAAVLPTAPGRLAGRGIGTKLGENALGQAVRTGTLRAPQTLLQKTAFAGGLGATAGAGFELAESGDLGQALKAGATVGTITGLLPGAGKLLGKTLSPIANALAKPSQIQNKTLRDITMAAVPVRNIIKSAGKKSAAFLNKLDDIDILGKQIRSDANAALTKFSKSYNRLTPEQRKIFYEITSHNTAEHSSVQARGGKLFSTKELMAQTDDTLIKQAIKEAEGIVFPVSRPQRGAAFTRKAKSADEVFDHVTKKNPEAKPMLDFARTSSDDALRTKLNDIRNKVDVLGIEGLDDTERALYQAYQNVAGEKLPTKADSSKQLNALLREFRGDRIIRIAGEPAVIFPTTFEEAADVTRITREMLDAEITRSTELTRLAQTNPTLADVRARQALEATLGKKTGPAGGQARAKVYETADEAIANGINIDAIEAYSNFIRRKSNTAAQFGVFGKEIKELGLDVTGLETTDALSRANRGVLMEGVREDLAERFSGKELDTMVDLIDSQVDIFLNGANFGTWTSKIKEFNAFKLTTAFLKNIYQSTSAIMESDIPTFLKGTKSIFTQEGRAFAKKAAVAQEQVFETAATGKIQKVLNKILKPLTFIENNINRVASANAGMHWAEHLAKIANGKTRHAPDALNRLEELLGTQFKRGKAIVLTEKDLIKAANRFTAKTQFGFNPLDMPYWANTPFGSIAFQFKNFAYNQMVFILRNTAGELQRGNPGRATANLMAIMTLYPATGSVIGAIENVLFGRETESDLLTVQGYLDRVTTSGGLGYATDVMRSLGVRGGEGVLLSLAGPTAATFASLIDLFRDMASDLGEGDIKASLEDVAIFTSRQLGGAGAIGRNIFGAQ